MPYYDDWIDDECHKHETKYDSETGEKISDTIKYEPDPDEIRDREMEEGAKK